MKEFSVNDVKTLKHLDKNKLDGYIMLLEQKEADKVKDIGDIFGQKVCSYKENTFLEIYSELEKGETLISLTPEKINFYIWYSVENKDCEKGKYKESVDKGYFITLLKLLKTHYEEYLENSEYYENKYGSENLISDDEDCENGRKAGNLAVCTNPDWEEDWKEFIKHDVQFEGESVLLLLIHKLKLMQKFYSPESSEFHFGEAKKVYKQVTHALDLAKGCIETDVLEQYDFSPEADKVLQKNTRKFFLYIANHFRKWWN